MDSFYSLSSDPHKVSKMTNNDMYPSSNFTSVTVEEAKLLEQFMDLGDSDFGVTESYIEDKGSLKQHGKGVYSAFSGSGKNPKVISKSLVVLKRNQTWSPDDLLENVLDSNFLEEWKDRVGQGRDGNVNLYVENHDYGAKDSIGDFNDLNREIIDICSREHESRRVSDTGYKGGEVRNQLQRRSYSVEDDKSKETTCQDCNQIITTKCLLKVCRKSEEIICPRCDQELNAKCLLQVCIKKVLNKNWSNFLQK